MVGRALRRQDKRNRTPAKRVEDDEEVDADDCEDIVASESVLVGVDCLVDANVEHGERLAGSASDERPL